MRTEMCLAALEHELSTNCGDMFEACRAVGVSQKFVIQWRKDDRDVNARLAEAQRIGYMRIESAAIQRAVNGHMEDVYYQGDVVGQKVVHHDGLMQAVLKAKLPEYKGEGGGVSVNVNVANIMPRANSYEEWLTMKDVTIARRDAQEALPAPAVELSPVIEAEYVEVCNSPFEGLGL